MELSNSKITENLPPGPRTFLAIPTVSDIQEFLAGVAASADLHYPWVAAPDDEAQYHQYLQRLDFKTHIGFFVKHLENKQIIGVININEIVAGNFQSGYLGFYALQPYSAQGLMSEGLSLVLEYYFERLKLHRLEANIQPGNHKSINFITRHAFRHEGFSPKYLKINNQWQDHERFAKTREDYSAAK